MQRANLVSVLNSGAALFYAMALTAFRPQYRERLFANARMQRLKAVLAWCGVPSEVIRKLPTPVMCDKALCAELALSLAKFKAGELSDMEMRDVVMGYFPMPMPHEEYQYLLDYTGKVLATFLEEEGGAMRYAHEIGGVIEAERDHYAMRLANPGSADPFNFRAGAVGGQV